MGAIEDVRKVMQDFLAPELRAMNERLKAIEAGHQELKTEMKAEFKELRAEMARQFEKAEVRADTRYHELSMSFHLEERVKRIEDRQLEGQ